MTQHLDNVKQYPISLNEVICARSIVSPFIKPTQLIRYDGLSRLLSAEICIKHENHNPTGSFKIRGGTNPDASSEAIQYCRGDYIFHGESWSVGCNICKMVRT